MHGSPPKYERASAVVRPLIAAESSAGRSLLKGGVQRHRGSSCGAGIVGRSTAGSRGSTGRVACARSESLRFAPSSSGRDRPSPQCVPTRRSARRPTRVQLELFMLVAGPAIMSLSCGLSRTAVHHDLAVGPRRGRYQDPQVPPHPGHGPAMRRCADPAVAPAQMPARRRM